MNRKLSKLGVLENIFMVVLVFYPLRHINQGIDFWDTGYSYANFQYMGTEHMDSMWLFATYLSNAVGHLLMKLPRADMLMGMNLYTGLFVSLCALAGYFFCTRKLHMSKFIAFAGELAAISMCWCPTASLYNYLTYVFFLGAVILLYIGLAEEKSACLVCAGVLLGANVLVRFSNLPEAAMIAAVWAYDFILWLEERKGFWRRLFRHTLLCLAGYAAALVVLFGYIHIRYGMGEYIEGIRRLFAMTDNAADYKATAMIMQIVGTYVENLYWAVRIGVIAAGGIVIFAAAGWFQKMLGRWTDGQRGMDGKAKDGMTAGIGQSIHMGAGLFGNGKVLGAVSRSIHIGVRLLWIAVCGAMLGWLYYRKFCSMEFYSYDSMRRPGILFMMLAMLIAAVRIFHKKSPKEEKLISGILILVILLTSVGSNNEVYPSMNNLFIAAPYTLWESWRFIRCVGDKKIWGGLNLYSFPVKGILATFLILCGFQFVGFGMRFVFAEATGIQEATATVDNNKILRNIKMNPQKAQWMQELSEYVNENELEGKELITYGYIPSLTYYLQMPAAFNPWSDLDSYSFETMEKDMALLEGRMLEGTAEKPVILLENTYVLYAEEGKAAEQEPKWGLLMDFMSRYNYEQVFRNGKFALYR